MKPSVPFKVALVSMPWSIFNRPSIQLGALQSFLNSQEGYRAQSFHPYLYIAKTIGTELYHSISLSAWGGEALFSSLLYPEQKSEAKKLFYNSLKGKTSAGNFDNICNSIDTFCQKWIDESGILSYDLIGFSVCFSQLLPSLYMARCIKKKKPTSTIVFGGSSCSGELGQSAVKAFSDIDYVVSGEGETTLLNLCSYLEKKSNQLPKNIYSANQADIVQGKTLSPLKELKLYDLPAPDYRDYFREMVALFPEQPFIPVIPVEFSRGCWWNKCSFCNLNIQWKNYRFKSSDRMLEEVLALSRQYESLHFTFTDNALPPSEADSFFQQLSQQHLDLDFFAEIRAIAKPERLSLYRLGGLSTVQIGIEALSTSLLKKLNKGTTTIDNIAVIKMCSEMKIQMEGNLIVEFPGSLEKEVEETLVNLDYLLPFYPLDTATFFLGYGSPVYSNCKEYQIDTTLVHSKNRQLFPKQTLDKLTLLQNSFRGDRTIQQKRWQPVRKKIEQWKEFHKNRKATTHPLSYRDGKTFLIIRQEQLVGPALHHRLRGLSREIYLACKDVTQIEQLNQKFPQVKTSNLEKFLQQMCEKRLMFLEDNHVLSLAVRCQVNTSAG